MLPTCRQHVSMSPISRRHCMSIGHGEGSDICFFCQKLPLPTANKTTTNFMPPKKKKKKNDVVTATACRCCRGVSVRFQSGESSRCQSESSRCQSRFNRSRCCHSMYDRSRVATIEPYFGAHGEATFRAARSLPPLPGFEAF